MNTCQTNIPYFLTANHGLDGQESSWVFQFFFYSTDCTTNTGYREDVQFTGATVKANYGGSDFALLQLNQTPAINSGLNYAGWNRNFNTVSLSTTMLHHPKGDVMKISQDYQAPQLVNFGSAMCWKLTLDLGGRQAGSSGGPYFDQYHRIIGQHYGVYTQYADDPCHPDVYGGAFYYSWEGGGTPSTRLKDWLDPSNSGALTTNTTNIANLSGSSLSLSLSGGSNFLCSGSTTFTLNGAPPLASVVWSIDNTNAASLSSNGNQATVTQIGTGTVWLTATVGSSACYTNNVVRTKIQMGGYENYTGVISGPNGVCKNQTASYSYDATNYPGITIQSWTIPTGWNLVTGGGTSSYVVLKAPSTNYPPTGSLVLNGTVCGNSFVSSKFIYLNNCTSFMVAPNPATEAITITETDDNTGERIREMNVNAVEIINKMGDVVLRKQYKVKNIGSLKIPVGHLRSDLYTIRIFDGIEWEAHQVLIAH
jgi:hypothetical protein